MVSYIAFDINNYIDDKTHKTDTDAFWKDIGNTMEILTKNYYDIAFKYEDCGIYILSFVHTNEALGDDVIRIMSPEDWEEFIMFKAEKEDSNEDTDN